MKYVLRNKTYGTFFKSRWYKGVFHYVVDFKEAKRLTKREANKLWSELNNSEKFEILTVKENWKNDKKTK